MSEIHFIHTIEDIEITVAKLEQILDEEIEPTTEDTNEPFKY